MQRSFTTLAHDGVGDLRDDGRHGPDGGIGIKVKALESDLIDWSVERVERAKGLKRRRITRFSKVQAESCTYLQALRVMLETKMKVELHCWVGGSSVEFTFFWPRNKPRPLPQQDKNLLILYPDLKKKKHFQDNPINEHK